MSTDGKSQTRRNPQNHAEPTGPVVGLDSFRPNRYSPTIAAFFTINPSPLDSGSTVLVDGTFRRGELRLGDERFQLIHTVGDDFS